MKDVCYGAPTTVISGYINCGGTINVKDIVYTHRHPYVGEDGIYKPCQEYAPECCDVAYQMIISKEMFVEAYNKWIKGEENLEG